MHPFTPRGALQVQPHGPGVLFPPVNYEDDPRARDAAPPSQPNQRAIDKLQARQERENNDAQHGEVDPESQQDHEQQQPSILIEQEEHMDSAPASSSSGSSEVPSNDTHDATADETQDPPTAPPQHGTDYGPIPQYYFRTNPLLAGRGGPGLQRPMRPHRVRPPIPPRPVSDSDDVPEIEHDDEEEEEAPLGFADETETEYFPRSIRDVRQVAGILSALLLPELVQQILEGAEYWLRELSEAKTSSLISSNNAGKVYLATWPIGASVRVQHGSSHQEDLAQDNSSAKSSEPMQEQSTNSSQDDRTEIQPHPTRSKRGPVRKVVFTILSHDQGTSWDRDFHNTYGHSWTWFETSVNAFDGSSGEAQPRATSSAMDMDEVRRNTERRRRLLTNVHADWELRRHVITWRADGDVHSKTVTQAVRQEPSANAPARAWPRSAWPAGRSQPNNGSPLKTDEELLARAEGSAEWVAGLREGDVVRVEPWARFPGWCNYVEGVRVDVYLGGGVGEFGAL